MRDRTLSADGWPDDFADLERFRIAARQRAASHLPGRRRGRTAGPGIDFADFRRYSPGDDVRSIDWNLYIRLRRLFARRFHAESELAIHLLVDVSRSMAFGRADKLECVKRVARALSFVGLRHLDPVGVATFSDRLLEVLPPRRAGGQLSEIHRRLERAEADGRTDFGRALREYGTSLRRPGMAIVLSDFLSPGGYEVGLEYLLYKRLELVLVQVQASEELDPRLPESAELVDAEDHSLPRLPIDRHSVAAYRRGLRSFQEELVAFCRRRRVPLVRLESSCSFAGMARSLLASGVWQTR